MAGANEPKKETVRIKLPSGSAGSPNGPRDTVRINLPPRQPTPLPAQIVNMPKPTPPRPPTTVLPGLGQTPPPPAAPVLQNAAASTGLSQTGVVPPSSGPKKETARIVVMPEAEAAPAGVKMSKTQPLVTAAEPL